MLAAPDDPECAAAAQIEEEEQAALPLLTLSLPEHVRRCHVMSRDGKSEEQTTNYVMRSDVMSRDFINCYVMS